MTVLQMLQKRNELQEQLTQLRFKLDAIPCIDDILTVADSSDFFTPLADQLVKLISDRDEPMTYVEIDAVFKASGFEYSEKHVLACSPDSQETVNEQAAYYRRNA